MAILAKIGLIGALVGVVGTALGGVFSLAIRRPRGMLIGALMALSAGIMLAVVFRDLVPEAFELGGMVTTLIGTIFGLIAMKVLDHLSRHIHEGRSTANQSADNRPPSYWSSASERHSRLIRTSLFIGLGIAIHNLPEGMAIGAGYAATETLGFGIALVIALHNVPEGLAMAGPMRGANTKAGRIIGWTALAGAPMGIGAIIGAAIGGVSPLILSTALGFAGGAMLYIIFVQLLPDAKRLATGFSTSLATAAGILIGLAILHAVEIIQTAKIFSLLG